ncbi:hypothetical protein UFOVP352_40 [uncultured Caudovirales phage]|uniref:CopG family transcriptional regulator n=1 Tax=uncultured Caudovirales phage TaxID=2100421 RepID=A0A6J5SSN9_9CAUD|nr:hypothetical protein UFOVP352_40 [uncultured Caudovirales phage]CAB4218463.1 hypothetical protein UFOVP1607_22 [uncultured Caudovirales phage]
MFDVFKLKVKMRTTISIDDDVFLAAKNLAAMQHKTIGEVISSLARLSLCKKDTNMTIRNGVPLLQSEQKKCVTLELVNKLRDELI